MNKRIIDAFNLITELINSNNISNVDFYKEILFKISSVISADYYGIYFVSSDDFELKGFVTKDNKNHTLNDEIFHYIQNQDETTHVYKNNGFVICTKLLIRNSLFGFVVAIRDDNYTQDEIKSFEALVSVVAYLMGITDVEPLNCAEHCSIALLEIIASIGLFLFCI